MGCDGCWWKLFEKLEELFCGLSGGIEKWFWGFVKCDEVGYVCLVVVCSGCC